MKKLSKYSIGIGDRFGHQGEAQLNAIMRAAASGIEITPVWNKSNREHSYIHSHPNDTRIEADATVKALRYNGPYFVDADHINPGNVHNFIEACDFFTLDVASEIGTLAPAPEIEKFISSCNKYYGDLKIPGIDHSFTIDEKLLRGIAERLLKAITVAGKIYNIIKEQKGESEFVTEISMDEVESPQSPIELFFILKMVSQCNIPIQTIAPKFSGRFNKGVDYSGDVKQFGQEFEEDVLVIDFAVKEFGLPDNLKLSVHSGSDKFSIYPEIFKSLKKYDKGVHVKTAGTTWLEEVIGLALAGGEALEMAKNIYREGLLRQKELCAPYADVIDIKNDKLPSVQEVSSWSGEKFANTLRHNVENPDYNPNFRQLIHVAYKIAAEYGKEYTILLEKHRDLIGNCVEENIYRHLEILLSF